MHANPILRVKNGLQTGDRFPLQKRIIMIGRDSINDIILDDNSISRQHARITRKDLEYWVEDLGSTNGTHINDKEITEPTQIKFGDMLRVGLHIELIVVSPAFSDQVPDATQEHPIAFEGASMNGSYNFGPVPSEPITIPPGNFMVDPPTVRVPAAGPAMFSLQILSGSHANQLLPLGIGEHTVGRKKDNKIVLSDEDISGQHAVLHVQSEGIWIKDLNSSNGTYVNGSKITEPVWLKPGDAIQLGPTMVAHMHRGLPSDPTAPSLSSLPHNPGAVNYGVPSLKRTIEVPSWLLIALISLAGLIALTSLGFAFLIGR